jgi:rubrerythrin
MVVILMGLIVFAALLIVGYPLVNAEAYEHSGAGLNGDENFEHLASARNSVFEAIRDLEFDHATDKLSDADYQSMRARFDAKAVEVLRKMDALDAAKAKRASTAREAGGGGAGGKAQMRRSGGTQSLCPHCGTRVEAADRFCPVCGTRLT